MVGAILFSFVAVSLAVAGLALLLWWLSRLWQRREETVDVPAIEIKAEPVEILSADVGVTEAQVEADAPAEDVETPAVVVEEGEVEPDAPAEEVVVATEAEVEAEATEPDTQEPEVGATPDDLTRIEGIGPKISSVLQAAGISTYAHLASTSPANLRQILEDTDPRLLRISNPDTWPEQASFAAGGDWDGLDEMQNSLKGGKRT
jgi:predicted flap endonuclease-1-like 5' DNA nuclease